MSVINQYKDFIFRTAIEQDIEFLISSICHAEKSGTSKLPLAWLLGKTEEELHEILQRFLKEDIEGSEFSLSGFVVVEHQGCAIGANNAWIEKQNEFQLSSALIKAHLFKNMLTAEEFQAFQEKTMQLKNFMIEREENVLQMEYGYTVPEYQGQGINSALIEARIAQHKLLYPEVEKAQIHIFANNQKSIATCQKAGFSIVKQTLLTNAEIAAHFPYYSKILIEKQI
jgi:ribosomal protein S18 acetylase RimI-like enzyme